MGGVGLLIFIILFFALRRGGASSLPKVFWQVAFWKFLMFVAVLPLIAMTGLVGVAVLVLEIILLLAPALVLRWIVVPLGVPRVAYWGATYCWPFEVIHESSAGAAFYGALALTRRRSSRQAIDWLEESVNRAQPVRGAGVVAAGLLAALRGDRHRARCLFLVADGLHRKLIPKRVRAIARELSIPSPIIERTPGAGLWLGQTDEEELGFSYGDLERYLDDGPQGVSPALAMRIERRIRSSEHKRQLPPLPDPE